MAIFRKIHVSFWRDEFIESLTPEQKYFYLYLMTNDRTRQCGIYEITIRQIGYDTGYNEETIKKLINFFVFKGKIKYSETTKEVALKNWGKYNDSTSPKVKICIDKELLLVKDRVLIEYLYSTDTHSQEEEEEEQEQKEEKEEDIKQGDILPIKSLSKKPTKDEFLKYCEERCATQGLKFFQHKSKASVRYDAWDANGWKDLNGNKISNWKAKIVANLQYWKDEGVKMQPSVSGNNEIPEQFTYENEK
jgi:hypothetical protein